MGRCIQTEAKEELVQRDHLSVAWAHQSDQFADMSLNQGEIRHLLPDKHGPDKLARIVPLLPVGGEDAVTEKVFPLRMELIAYIATTTFSVKGTSVDISARPLRRTHLCQSLETGL